MSKVKSMYYELSIGGKRMKENILALINSIDVEDANTGSDLLTISITDPNFEFIGSESLFLEEKPVKFKGGWSDDLSVTFDGYVSVIDLSFPDSGSPQITLHCMDNTYLMNRKAKKRTWQNIRESDVVKQIFKEYGLKANVDTTKKVEETITQSDKTDIEFLIELANNQFDDYIVYVEGKNGYFKKKPSLGKSQATLVYRNEPYDIKSFSPRINKEVKKEEVEVSDVNSKNKKVVKATVNKTTSTKKTQGKPVNTSSKKVTSTPKVTAKPKPEKKATDDKVKYKGNGKWSKS